MSNSDAFTAAEGWPSEDYTDEAIVERVRSGMTDEVDAEIIEAKLQDYARLIQERA